MDQERFCSLAMCTLQREIANEVITNDTELRFNKFAGKHGRNTCTHFSDQMLIYLVIFGLTYCICSRPIRIS